MPKRRLYETEVFCEDCDATAPDSAHESSTAAGRWANKHAARTGHETITRYSYAYRGPIEKLKREIERKANQ